jgi:hypothetical protein
MTLKTTWVTGDSFTASDQNAVATQVNTNTSDISGKQAHDTDLDDIGGLTPTNGDTILRVAGHWLNQSMSQLKTALGLVKADVGLGSVDNTADSAKAVLSASKLTTARNINGVSFDGTAAITVADATKEPAITVGTSAQYYRGDKTMQTLNQDAVPDGTTNRAYSAADKTKLAGIASGATANSSDATLENRANHTGTQTASTISDFSTAADARVTAAVGVSVQAADSDLTAIAAVAPSNDDFLQRKAGAWTNRSVAQVKADLGIPADFVFVAVADATARAAGSGDWTIAQYVGRAFTLTSVTYQFATADASGSTAIEVRRNGSQVASSNLTVTAANQADGTGTDAARTAAPNQSFAVGDRIGIQITSVGTTPGKGLRAYLFGTWN